MNEPAEHVHHLTRRTALAGIGAAAGLVGLAACTSGSGSKTAGGSSAAGGGDAGSTTSEAPQPQAQLVFGVKDKATDVGPTPLEVTADGGTLQTVTLTAGDGTTVAGELSGDKKSWTSTDQLAYGTDYSVEAVAAGDNGVPTNQTLTFTTVTPTKQAFPAIGPLDGTTVGVGMPVRVYFDEEVKDRKAAQKAMTLTVEPKQEGSWSWRSNYEVHWRPKVYWKAGSKVTLETKLYGVSLGNGVWGKPTADRTISFTVGDSHVSKASTTTHQMQVFTNGQLVRTIPIAAGAEQPGRYTHNGVHVVSDKKADMTMDSTTYGLALDAGGYVAKVQWATRISNNGEFVHSAPWSIADQGVRNVSHGCLNASPDNAKWFFEYSIPGDVVEVSGSPVPLTVADGDIYDWTIGWSDFRKGSAL